MFLFLPSVGFPITLYFSPQICTDSEVSTGVADAIMQLCHPGIHIVRMRSPLYRKGYESTGRVTHGIKLP